MGDHRPDRHPNDHYGFGIGVHYCLGANLARLEEVELAAPVERMHSSFVGGIKRMRLRWRIRG